MCVVVGRGVGGRCEELAPQLDWAMFVGPAKRRIEGPGPNAVLQCLCVPAALRRTKVKAKAWDCSRGLVRQRQHCCRPPPLFL